MRLDMGAIKKQRNRFYRDYVGKFEQQFWVKGSLSLRGLENEALGAQIAFLLMDFQQ
jgi:hypothetical protein